MTTGWCRLIMGAVLVASVALVGGQPAVAAPLVFADQTPAAPLIAGAYQRYVSLLGDGTNLALWCENRTAGNIELRTSSSGYTGFGAPVTTSGLAALAHPRVYSDGGTGYVGLFWDTSQSPPNGIVRLASADGVSWAGTAQVTIANSPFPTSKIWGVVGYFTDVAGDTDVLYYTEGTGANEQLYRATATDGLSFTHQGTAFTNPATPGLGTGVGVGSQVIYDAAHGEYALLWCGESTTEGIGYATSTDGLTFSQQAIAIPSGPGHTDLEETSFVVNGAQVVGVYTGDFGGDSSNHIGAYTTGSGGEAIPEPATLCLLAAGSMALAWRRRKRS